MLKINIIKDVTCIIMYLFLYFVKCITLRDTHVYPYVCIYYINI